MDKFPTGLQPSRPPPIRTPSPVAKTPERPRALRLSVRTPPFHGGERGSTPLGRASSIPATRASSQQPANWTSSHSKGNLTRLRLGPFHLSSSIVAVESSALWDAGMIVSNFVASAFAQARARQDELVQRWISISHKVGSLLPRSLLAMSVQRVGEMDVLLRAIEDEFRSAGPDEFGFNAHYQIMMGDLWVGSLYEICRLLSERKLSPQTDTFKNLSRELKLIRIPLEKHEIASDRRISGSLTLETGPDGSDNRREYEYRTNDNTRSHIMPQGFSEKFSQMWHVIDVERSQSYWIERRELSDRFMSIWL